MGVPPFYGWFISWTIPSFDSWMIYWGYPHGNPHISGHLWVREWGLPLLQWWWIDGFRGSLFSDRPAWFHELEDTCFSLSEVREYYDTCLNCQTITIFSFQELLNVLFALELFWRKFAKLQRVRRSWWRNLWRQQAGRDSFFYVLSDESVRGTHNPCIAH